MVEKTQLLARLAGMAARLPATESLTARLAQSARTMLAADGAAVTLLGGSAGPMVLTTTGEDAGVLQHLEETLGSGPGVDAAALRAPVVARLDDGPTRWPVYVESAARRTAAVLVAAAPMTAGADVVGVLVLHWGARPAAGGADEGAPVDVSDLAAIADAMAAVLVHESSGADLTAGPWTERATLQQAVGMVIAQLALTPDDALTILRAHAFATDTDLGLVARAVLARELVFRTGEEP